MTILDEATIADLRAQDQAHLLHSQHYAPDHAEALIFDHGEGVWLTDVRGRRYIDGLSSKDVPAEVNHVRRGGMVGCRLVDFLLPSMLPIPQGKKLENGDRVLVRITNVEPRKGRVRLRYLEHLPTDVDAVLAKDAAAKAEAESESESGSEPAG